MGTHLKVKDILTYISLRCFHLETISHQKPKNMKDQAEEFAASTKTEQKISSLVLDERVRKNY